jgi:hypothetical protein
MLTEDSSASVDEVIAHLHEHDGTDDPEFLESLEEQIRDQGEEWALGQIPVADVCNWCSDRETAEYYAEQELDEFPAIIVARMMPPDGELMGARP